MTTVRIFMRGGHVYETTCAADAPLLAKLGGIVTPGATGAVQLEIERDGVRRGLAIPYSQIVAVETDPPVVFRATPEPAVIRPASYIRIPEFLSKEENRAIVDYALRKQPDFEKSKVEGGKLNHRHSQVVFKLDDLDVSFEAKVRELLPDAAAYFGLPLPADFTFEMQMTTHSEGGYFRIHNDNGSPNTASRFLTYVYYFYREPIGFSGGQLRIYDDSRIEARNWVPVATFAEIQPQNNMLLFFPSGQFHEVLPTLCCTGDFADGRFTLNGWIRTPRAEQSA